MGEGKYGVPQPIHPHKYQVRCDEVGFWFAYKPGCWPSIGHAGSRCARPAFKQLAEWLRQDEGL